MVSIVWAQMYAPTMGSCKSISNMLGIQLNIAPLGEPNMAIFALIVVNIWQWTGFSMIMYIAGINNIPGDIFRCRHDRRRSWIEVWPPALLFLCYSRSPDRSCFLA